MAVVDYIRDLMNTDVVIKKHGAVTANTPDGPTYAADITCYDDKGAFYLMSAGEALVWDRLGNPSTHNLVLDPALINYEITADAWAEIDGRIYDLYRGENDILSIDDVATFKAALRA